MLMLPVDAAIVVPVGPLIDDTDFKTLETAIAYDESGMSVDLFENSGSAITKTDLVLTTGGANDWAHKGNAVYEVEITAAQNNTEGELWVVGICDGVLVFESPHYQIVPQNVYDALVAGSDYLDVAVVEEANIDFGATKKASINTEADTAISDHDPPTKAEMDTALGNLNDLDAAAVNAEVDTALGDYDGPTKVELDAAESNIRGADSDTLKTLSDQVDGVSAGDATEAKQDEILVDLVDIKGTDFVKDTHSLVNLVAGAAIDMIITSEEIVIS